MLSLSGDIRVFIAREPGDFRKAHDGLISIVRDQFGNDPFDGSIFVFLNRRKERVKVLHWDRDGFWLHYKRFEKSRFEIKLDGAEERVEIARPQFMMLLEGIDLESKRILEVFPKPRRLADGETSKQTRPWHPS